MKKSNTRHSPTTRMKTFFPHVSAHALCNILGYPLVRASIVSHRCTAMGVELLPLVAD